MTIEDIALTMTPGIGVKGVVHLLECFGDARQVFAASEELLTDRAELRPDLARRIARRSAMPAAEREWNYCRKHGLTAVASTDPEYPPLKYPIIPMYSMSEAMSRRFRCAAFRSSGRGKRPRTDSGCAANWSAALRSGCPGSAS